MSDIIPLTPEEIDALPEGTVVVDLTPNDFGELGAIRKSHAKFGRKGCNVVMWDNGCISVNYGPTRGKLRIAVNKL